MTLRDSYDNIPRPWIIPHPLKIVFNTIWVYDGIDIRIDLPNSLQNLFMDFGSKFCGVL